MKSKDLRTKNLGELNSLLQDFKKEFFNLRFQKSFAQINNFSRIRVVKKTIARILTFMKIDNNRK